MRSKFERAHAKIVELVNDGETFADACERAGVEAHTGYNWASEGRRNPACKYAKFAQAIDAAKTSARLDREEEEGDYEPGVVEREVRALIAGRNLDEHGRIAAAQGRMLARQLDNLAASRSGSAALGLAAVSRRLDDIIMSLQIQPKDALSELLDERAARLASFGIGRADVPA